MLDTADLVINELGGTDKVAAALDTTPSTVSGWRERGIPPGRWPALVRLAAELDKSELVTFEALAALPKPAREAAA